MVQRRRAQLRRSPAHRVLQRCGFSHAPRPDQPANYRPAPIVASKVSGSTTNWTANIAAKNRYQIVYTTGGAWTVLGGSVYFPGTLGATITGATPRSKCLLMSGLMSMETRIWMVPSTPSISQPLPPISIPRERLGNRRFQR